MKRLVSVMTLAACLLAVSTTVRAQDCSSWNNWSLAGTYTMSGSGYVDLSKLLPGLGMPSGMIPMSWVGAHTYNGIGGGTGWISLNAGGNLLNAQLTGMTYSMQSDCSVQSSFSLKIKELGITIGPFPRVGVVVRKPDALEIHIIFGGPPPGTAGVGLDLGVEQRISVQNF
jgi:hypothetical protein